MRSSTIWCGWVKLRRERVIILSPLVMLILKCWGYGACERDTWGAVVQQSGNDLATVQIDKNLSGNIRPGYFINRSLVHAGVNGGPAQPSCKRFLGNPPCRRDRVVSDKTGWQPSAHAPLP